MKIESKFHCDLKSNFKNEAQMVRAFIYTDYSIEPHQHDFYEINVILSGRGTHLIEENSFFAQKGDVFVIPPNIIHAYTDAQSMDVYHILIKPELFRNYAADRCSVKGYDLLMEIEPFLRNHYEKKLFLHLSPVELAFFENDIALINDTGISKLENCEAIKNQTIIKNLYWMSLLLYRQLHGAKAEAKLKEQSILEVLEYMHKNYHKKIDIDSLCRCAGMSRPTLMRRFKEVCGCSPMRYLMQYRIGLAQELLKEGRMSKTQIAYECGFYDLSHMEKYIRNYRSHR